MNENEKINVIKVICELQSLLEGYNHEKNCKNHQLTIKTKILTYLYAGKSSPFYLTKKIGIAKTNLNIICNELIEDKLIEKCKEYFDKRIVSYKITELGKKYLLKELNNFKCVELNEKREEELNVKIQNILQILN